MSAITIRNLKEETHRALKARAVKNARSAEAEVRAILDEALFPPDRIKLGTALWELGRKYGGVDLDIERDQSPVEPAVFD